MGLFSWIPFVGETIDSAVDFISDPSNISEWAQNTFNPNKNADKYAKENQQIQNEFNSSEAKLQRDWSADQAQISRDFSTNEREAQQAWQEKMIAEQNVYNSPAKQIERLVAAGVSPTQLSGVGDSASPSGVPSGSSSSIPSGASASGSALSGAHGSSPVDPFLSLAQVRLANAQADKAEKDAGLAQTESERIKALLDGELKLQGSTYRVQMSESMRNSADAKISLKEIEKIDSEKNLLSAQVDEIRVHMDLMNKQGELTQKEIDSYEDKLAVELYESLSRVELNGKMGISYLASANASNAQADLSREEQKLVCKQIVHQTIQNGIVAFDYKTAKETHPSHVQLQIAGNVSETNDIEVLNNDGWRYPRLFLKCLGQVMGANVSLSHKIK